jgi:hypothetical protein
LSTWSPKTLVAAVRTATAAPSKLTDHSSTIAVSRETAQVDCPRLRRQIRATDRNCGQLHLATEPLAPFHVKLWTSRATRCPCRRGVDDVRRLLLRRPDRSRPVPAFCREKCHPVRFGDVGARLTVSRETRSVSLGA